MKEYLCVAECMLQCVLQCVFKRVYCMKEHLDRALQCV